MWEMWRVRKGGAAARFEWLREWVEGRGEELL
jgi:hypothetical protein